MIPDAAFDTPVLRGLDAGARAAIAAAGRVVARAAAAPIYRDGDDSDAFFVVIAGAVELSAVRRGDAAASLLRVARAGDAFGEEALLPGIARRVSAAAAAGGATVAEIPVAVFRRVTGRADDARDAARERRYLERAAVRDLLALSAFARELAPADLELLLDGTQLEQVRRGTPLYEAGDRAEAAYVVVDGLVQLVATERGAVGGGDGERAAVVAYLGRGDFFGDQEALALEPRRTAAVAAGDSWCAVVARDALATLADRNPGLLPRLRRVAEERDAAQADLVGAAAARSTRHVFRDLYRMQMARSLLVIDQDRCVRCGHCAWSCAETHDGTSRLIRRGDTLVARLTGADASAATLLLPSTCQHCRHAACMIDCPTGAIGRDPAGEVFIRPSLCTGCGNCAKACPWDNIQMAPRPAPAAGASAASAEIAVTCDLCRGSEAPACVEACPTGAVLRLDPSRDVAEVAQLLGGLGSHPVRPAPVRAEPVPPVRPERGPAGVASKGGLAIAGALGAAIAIAASGLALHHAGRLLPDHGAGLACGGAAGLAIAALAAYVLPKRRVRARLRPRRAALRLLDDGDRPAPRSRTRPHLIAHVALGVLAPALALAHAGLRAPASPGGALAAALALTTLLGVIAAVAYRVVPRALTRLERRGLLPEDLAGERDDLEARLYRAVSGHNDRVKALADRVLVPYARARTGALALVLSRRDLADEERALRRRIDDALGGRRASLDGVDELIRVAVELRALPARRALVAALRVWPPIHAVAGAMTAALLIVHVALAVLR
jgi:Fe-S-cluster-containing dehydrogenase component/CRP-like cAMP-binding protein